MAHYQTMTSDKNKDTAFWLCLFGGWFGLHLYYVGRIGKGLLYTCTLGFFFIGWILDLITIALGGFKDNTGAPLRANKKQNNEPTDVNVINQTYTTIKQDDNITQIERLAKLKNDGIITQEEFEKKKRELL